MGRAPLGSRRRRAHPRCSARSGELGWWSTGPRVAEFEERSRVLGLPACPRGRERHRRAAARAARSRVRPGDEVDRPSLKFVAAANTIAHTGATPVFCDIRGEEDLNSILPTSRQCSRPGTKALVVLHYGATPATWTRLEIAGRHGLVGDRRRRPRSGRDAARPPGRDARRRRLLQLLLEQESADRRRRDDRHRRRRPPSVRLLRSHGMTTLTWDRHRGHATSYEWSSRASTTGSTRCARRSGSCS